MKVGTGPITGDGSVSVLPAALSGTGSVVNPVAPVTISGALTALASSLSGAVTFTPQPITGTGDFADGAPTFAGMASFSVAGVSGTGTFVVPAATVSGIGTVEAPQIPSVTASGSWAVPAPLLAGSGTVTVPSITASGELVGRAASFSGTGDYSALIDEPQAAPSVEGPWISHGTVHIGHKPHH